MYYAILRHVFLVSVMWRYFDYRPDIRRLIEISSCCAICRHETINSDNGLSCGWYFIYRHLIHDDKSNTVSGSCVMNSLIIYYTVRPTIGYTRILAKKIQVFKTYELKLFLNYTIYVTIFLSYFWYFWFSFELCSHTDNCGPLARIFCFNQQAKHSNCWGPPPQKISNPSQSHDYWLGTTMSPWTADLKADRPGTKEVLVQ